MLSNALSAAAAVFTRDGRKRGFGEVQPCGGAKRRLSSSGCEMRIGFMPENLSVRNSGKNTKVSWVSMERFCQYGVRVPMRTQDLILIGRFTPVLARNSALFSTGGPTPVAFSTWQR
jgi:hypothetical protein